MGDDYYGPHGDVIYTGDVLIAVAHRSVRRKSTQEIVALIAQAHRPTVIEFASPAAAAVAVPASSRPHVPHKPQQQQQRILFDDDTINTSTDNSTNIGIGIGATTMNKKNKNKNKSKKVKQCKYGDNCPQKSHCRFSHPTPLLPSPTTTMTKATDTTVTMVDSDRKLKQALGIIALDDASSLFAQSQSQSQSQASSSSCAPNDDDEAKKQKQKKQKKKQQQQQQQQVVTTTATSFKHSKIHSYIPSIDNENKPVPGSWYDRECKFKDQCHYQGCKFRHPARVPSFLTSSKIVKNKHKNKDTTNRPAVGVFSTTASNSHTNSSSNIDQLFRSDPNVSAAATAPGIVNYNLLSTLAKHEVQLCRDENDDEAIAAATKAIAKANAIAAQNKAKKEQRRAIERKAKLEAERVVESQKERARALLAANAIQEQQRILAATTKQRADQMKQERERHDAAIVARKKEQQQQQQQQQKAAAIAQAKRARELKAAAAAAAAKKAAMVRQDNERQAKKEAVQRERELQQVLTAQREKERQEQLERERKQKEKADIETQQQRKKMQEFEDKEKERVRHEEEQKKARFEKLQKDREVARLKKLKNDEKKASKLKQVREERLQYWNIDRHQRNEFATVFKQFCIAEICRLCLGTDRRADRAGRISHHVRSQDIHDLDNSKSILTAIDDGQKLAYNVFYPHLVATNVKVLSPKNKQFHNKFGSILSWDETKKKYKVRFETTKKGKMGDEAYFLPENLEAQEVTASSSTSTYERGGKSGVPHDDCEDGTYCVETDAGECIVTVVLMDSLRLAHKLGPTVLDQTIQKELIARVEADFREKKRQKEITRLEQQREEELRIREQEERKQRLRRRAEEEERHREAQRARKERLEREKEAKRFDRERMGRGGGGFSFRGRTHVFDDDDDDFFRAFFGSFGGRNHGRGPHFYGNDDDYDDDDNSYDQYDEENGPSMEEHAEILGINVDASSKEIKKAFRQLALMYHPDKFDADKHDDTMTKEDAEEHFKKCSAAYEYFTSRRRREDE